MQSKYPLNVFSLIIFIALLIPLFFIHTNNKHDWGDDFAQYLLQAKQMTTVGHVASVSNLDYYGPDNKGTLFSVFLIPAILNTSNEILSAKILVTAMLIAGAVFFLFLLLKYFNPVVAFITVLLFCYNHHTLAIKDQVLPDIMLTAFFLAVIWYSQQKKTFNTAIIIASLTVGIKSAGIVAPIALILFIISGKSPLTERKEQVKSGIFLIGTTLSILLINKVLWESNSASWWYLSVTKQSLSFDIIFNNATIYRQALGHFFEMEIPHLLNTFLKILILPAILAGFIMRITKACGVMELISIGYMILLLIYPYSNDPIRFLLPLVPLCLFYTLMFYSSVLQMLGVKYYQVALIVIVSGLALTNVKSTWWEIEKINEYPVNESGAVELFNHIKTNISINDTLSFDKPWALAWYTNRNCVPATAIYKANWLVIRSNSISTELFRNNSDSLIVFKNNKFQLLHIP